MLWVHIHDMKYRDMLRCMTGVLWSYQLIHVDIIAAFWTWSCQCRWFCLLSLPNHRLQFNTAPHHFTIYRSFFQLDVHMLKYGVPSHNFVRILAKVASVSEWQHCIWLVRSAFSCKRNCSMYLFLHSVSESTHLSYLEKPSTTNSCDGLVITFLDVEHRFPQ